MEDGPGKPRQAPPVGFAVRLIFFIAGVVAVLIGLAMWWDNGVSYNRHGTLISSRLTGSLFIAFGTLSVVSAFRRDPTKRFP